MRKYSYLNPDGPCRGGGGGGGGRAGGAHEKAFILEPRWSMPGGGGG